jgi:hypothetical protein
MNLPQRRKGIVLSGRDGRMVPDGDPLSLLAVSRRCVVSPVFPTYEQVRPLKGLQLSTITYLTVPVSSVLASSAQNAIWLRRCGPHLEEIGIDRVVGELTGVCP